MCTSRKHRYFLLFLLNTTCSYPAEAEGGRDGDTLKVSFSHALQPPRQPEMETDVSLPAIQFWLHRGTSLVYPRVCLLRFYFYLYLFSSTDLIKGFRMFGVRATPRADYNRKGRCKREKGSSFSPDLPPFLSSISALLFQIGQPEISDQR